MIANPSYYLSLALQLNNRFHFVYRSKQLIQPYLQASQREPWQEPQPRLSLPLQTEQKSSFKYQSFLIKIIFANINLLLQVTNKMSFTPMEAFRFLRKTYREEGNLPDFRVVDCNSVFFLQDFGVCGEAIQQQWPESYRMRLFSTLRTNSGNMFCTQITRSNLHNPFFIKYRNTF